MNFKNKKNLDSFETEMERLNYLEGMVLHESCYFDYNTKPTEINRKPSYLQTGNLCMVLRVINGWIYTINERETFVPDTNS